MSFVNSDQNFIIYWGAGIFQELRSEFRSQKQLASPMVLQKNYQNASVHCTVPCIVLRHIIIMVICTSSSSSELSINQNGVSMVKGKDIYIPTHRHTTVHCSMTNHSDRLLTIQSTAFCDLS